MEVFLAIILLLIILCMCISKTNKIMRIPVLMFLCTWCAVLFMSSLRLYGLYSLSFFATVLVAAHIFFFVAGYYLKLPKNAGTKQNNFQISLASEKLYKGNLLPIISLLFCIPLVILAYKYIGYVSTHTTGTRMVRFEAGVLFNSTKEIFLYNYFCTSYFNIFSVIFIYGIISRKIKIKLFIPCFISLACYLVIGFGRIIFVQLLLTVFIVYLLLHKKKRKNSLFRISVLFLMVLLFGLVAIVLVTALRQGTKITFSNFFIVLENTLVESFSEFYRYTEGPLRAFDYSINNYKDLFGFHFGRMALAGFDEILINILKYIGLDLVSMNSMTSALTTIDVPIGTNMTIIALFTCLFDFYFDFGFFGVIAYSFILGYSIATLSRQMSCKQVASIASISLYVFLIYIIIILPIKSIFGSPDTIITFIVTLVWNILDKKRSNCIVTDFELGRK